MRLGHQPFDLGRAACFLDLAVALDHHRAQAEMGDRRPVDRACIQVIELFGKPGVHGARRGTLIRRLLRGKRRQQYVQDQRRTEQRCADHVLRSCWVPPSTTRLAVVFQPLVAATHYHVIEVPLINPRLDDLDAQLAACYSLAGARTPG